MFDKIKQLFSKCFCRKKSYEEQCLDEEHQKQIYYINEIDYIYK